MEIEEKISLYCYFDEIDSTNDFLEKISEELKEDKPKPILVFSKKQKMGKGRGGKFFCSPEGGVYFSLLLPNFSSHPSFPLKVGLFLTKKIKKRFKIPVFIRWPNDLILKDMKYGGILIEAKGKNIIIGVGLNLEKDLSLKIKDQKITYLNKFTKEKINVEDFNKIIEKWLSFDFFKAIKEPLNFKEWKNYSYFKCGDKIIWEEKGEKKEGIYEGISEDGSLLAIHNNIKLNLYSIEKIYKK